MSWVRLWNSFQPQRRLPYGRGVAPGNNESTGKRYSGRTTPGNRLLKTTLVLCANSAVKEKDTFVQAKYQRLHLRREGKRTIMAVAPSILRAIWFLLREGVAYRELGGDYCNQHDRKRKMKDAAGKLRHLGISAESLPLVADEILTV